MIVRTLTIAEAAAHTGLSAHTLRYYEREGLLDPVERTAGGHRAYDVAALDRVAFLSCLRDTGMPIRRMRQFADLLRDDATVPRRIALLEDHERDVRARIADLEAALARIGDKITYYRGLDAGGASTGEPTAASDNGVRHAGPQPHDDGVGVAPNQ
jgi:DNA-binding transcriptional MerR regulator